MIGVDLQIAARNLTRHTRRNLFLGGALAAVTALLVLLSSLTGGVERAMMVSATTLLTGHVNVGGFFKITSGSAAPIVSEYPRALDTVRALVPEIDYVAVRGRGWAKAVSESSSMDLVLGGVEVAQERGFAKVIRPVEGRLEDLAQPDTVLLFQGQADRLKVKVGDVVTLSAPTTRGVNNTADVRVAVIARNVGLLSAFSAFIQGDTLRRLYGLAPTATGALHLYLKDPADAPAVASRLRAALAEAGWRVMEPESQPYWIKLMQKVPSEDWTGQKLDVTTWEDEMGQFKQFILGLRALTALLVFVLMVVVVIGILNTLAIAIRERTREIGTLRAIGMQRRKVLWLFVLETALLGLGGAAAGAAIASGIALLLNLAGIGVPEGMQLFLMQERLSFLLQPGAILADVLFLAGVTVVAALLPARRAARLRPVTAMHHIG
ncbi:ABC transporter permease [Anaeromyxobacter sp. PSR-1]|uniref:ABC transporter permease n=1 Tax=unclassified Anaeromyxobacter TaxID=2620896 RepID=UPI0005DF9450|nr:FtsX-like permease family protein [Anaeromyxobacter sp. PSR-1]GAO04210.1 ABC transporter permease YtrF [Anaeromyxobacter sp. PSR-1]